MTGFLGELLGAQLAIKVAGAAPNAVARLAELGDTRRRVAVRDSVFEVLLDSLSLNTVHFGTGLMLLLAAQAMQSGTFTVGDFTLFVVYLDELCLYTAEIGRLISDLKRVDVSCGRMRAMLPGQPRVALVAPAPVYLRGTLPQVPPPPARERLEHLSVHKLELGRDAAAVAGRGDPARA